MTDISKLAMMVREKLGVTRLDAGNFFYVPETDEMCCDKTLSDLRNGTLWYLMNILRTNEVDWLSDEITLERGEPLWKQSKPLSILKAKVRSDKVILVVKGKKTDRIEQKWKKVFSRKLSKVPVEFEWVETFGAYQVVEK